MAYLTQKEFHDAVSLLVNEMGLQRLRDKLVRLNALVSRRNVSSAETLASQLYLLTSGLRKQIAATYAFHGLWGEQLNAKLGKEGEEHLEELAKEVNACLTDDEDVIPEKAEALAAALGRYAQALAEKVGPDAAYLDMLLKAVRPVAQMLRANGLPPAPPPAESADPPATDAPSEQ